MQTQPKPTQQSFVSQTMNANAQKQGVDAVARLGSRFDSVSKIMSQSIKYEKQSIDYLSSMDKNIEKLTKDQKKSSEDLHKAIANVKQTVTTPNTKDHLAKQKDAGLIEERKNIASINDTLREELALRKAEAKNKGMGLLGGLALLTSLGGFIGFLATGKSEYLGAMIKGLKNAGKLMMDFFTMPIKLLKGAGEVAKHVGDVEKVAGKLSKGGSVFKFVQGMSKAFQSFNSIGGIVSGGTKAISGIGNFVKGFKNIGNVFKGLGGVMKIGGGVAAKGLGTASKSALKKIPVIGGLLGLFFGIQRFKKGDIAGGMLEIVSGVSSIIPGVGTAMSIAIDGLLLVNDLKGGSLLTGVNTSIKGAGAQAMKWGKDQLRNLPLIGTVIRVKEGMDLWGQGKKKEALQSFAKAGLFFNGGGTLIQIVSGIAELAGTWAGGGNKSIPSIPTGGTPNKGDAYSIGGGSNGMIPISAPSGLLSDGQKINNFIKSGAKSVGGFFSGAGVHLDGMKSNVMHNFSGMAQEYKSIYGKDIPVNSAYRSMAEQKVLYDNAVKKYGKKAAGKWAAPPGRSMHNFGYAMDIGDSAGNLKSEITNSPMGNLATKWGFEYPMDHEPWHIEPTGFKKEYANVRGGKAVDTPIANPSGDAYAIGGGDFDTQIKSNLGASNTKPTLVILTDDTVKALAIAIGSQYRENTSKNNSMQQNVGGKSISARGR